MRSFPALCEKKAQQQEKSAAKIDTLASKNTKHLWDEIDSIHSTRPSKWNDGNSTVNIMQQMKYDVYTLQVHS
jgi:2',3'-cyclic-nucleotide 2'-phosphodiesterase (5'-nucleotidase family)